MPAKARVITGWLSDRLCMLQAAEDDGDSDSYVYHLTNSVLLNSKPVPLAAHSIIYDLVKDFPVAPQGSMWPNGSMSQRPMDGTWMMAQLRH